MFWSCPSCHGSLNEYGDSLRCTVCAAQYPVVSGIPDLRIPGPCWIDRESDLVEARKLLAVANDASLETLIRSFFSTRRGWDSKRIELRTRQVIQGPQRIRSDLRSWLHHCVSPSGIFLDLGCGGGYLLSAAAAEGYAGAGLDVSLAWLVIAQKMIAEYGGEPILAAAMAEHIPLADSTLCGVVSLDVIEHVGDQTNYLNEIYRVVRPGGGIALSTPNRYSLTAEPHVFVWGVGWLPRKLQKHYVKWRSGLDYEYTTLLSNHELSKRLRKYADLQFEVVPGEITKDEIASFPARRAQLARVYNYLLRFSLMRLVFRLIGPFFRIHAEKKVTVLLG